MQRALLSLNRRNTCTLYIFTINDINFYKEIKAEQMCRVVRFLTYYLSYIELREFFSFDFANVFKKVS